MRSFVVVPGEAHTWSGMPEAAGTVTEFLANVRVTGDVAAAERLLAATVPAHQHTAERTETVVRTPAEYAAHVKEMLRRHGPITVEVDELLVEADHVFVRWTQHGWTGVGPDRETRSPRRYHREAGSAVYRVSEGRIQEYWIQLDQTGPRTQPCAETSPTQPATADQPGTFRSPLALSPAVRAGE